MGEAKYYLIAVSLGATWSKNQFTYHSTDSLEIGDVVLVPFGKATRPGFVVNQTTKPKVDTKEAVRVFDKLAIPNTSIDLVKWLDKNYPGMPGVHTQFILPGLVKDIKDKDFKTGTDSTASVRNLPSLTPTQTKAIKELRSTNKPQVLYGITGSGKTRVYQELAKEVLDSDKNILVIYPEISLTSHIKKAFEDVVGEENLHFYHSKNTPANQRKTWVSAIKNSSGKIFIGPRSALFLPINNLGLVVVDEAHDGSLKQDSGSRYNGLMVAGALSKIHKSKLILGSATPPVQETSYILNSGGSLVIMLDLAKGESKRSFEIIDMTEKYNISTGNHLISKSLQSAISKSLERGKQSLLFLNRRGTARSLICESCGWHGTCNRCDSSLTYHHDSHNLICHLCGKTQNTPSSCPDCSNQLKLKSPGTKAIENDLQKLFPAAKIMRFDSDNKKADSMLENYRKVRDGGADIIIGTQLITKGLDLPNLETVGILQADSSLFLPDYSSLERTFQLLTQVSGRVGRGHGDGKVYVQTYNPENKVFDYVINQDWQSFYEQELKDRVLSGFPPHKFMARVWVNKSSEQAAQKTLEKLASDFRGTVKVLGPAPSFYGKKAGKYSWQILLFSSSRSKLVSLVDSLPADTYFDLDPVSLL